jgi:hypothetical protein
MKVRTIFRECDLTFTNNSKHIKNATALGGFNISVEIN